MKPQKYGPFRYVPITQRPKITWPGNARVALWVIPNIEVFALDEKIPGGGNKVPDVRHFSTRDYGARVGVFRLAQTLERFGIRGTVALNSEVCDAYPEIIEETMRLKWEIMGHNESNSRILNEIPAEQERDAVLNTLNRIEKAIGKRPRGWLGSAMAETWNTLDYLLEGGIEYVCDWPNDDQPYLMNVGSKQLVSLPYGGEINDISVITVAKYSSAQFAVMVKNQFDVLYREGAESGRVMAIALHPFIIGQPHRIGDLERSLDYICKHEGVWLATGEEIVDHYLKAGATF